MEDLKSILKRQEGFCSSPCRCPAGFFTIGFGHKMGDKFKISLRVADLILDEDIHVATFQYESLGLNLNEIRKNVCINMIFWHGLAGFLRFKKTLHYIEYGNWDKAGDEMMDSNSGRKYKTRMTELAELMRRG